jgi:signal transduction histidine kinase
MFHSVRGRLTLWYTAILALVLITFSGISFALLVRAIRSATDASIRATARELAAAFSNDPTEVRLDFRLSNREVMVFTPSGRIAASSQLHLTSGERERLATLVRGRVDGFATIDGGAEGDGIRIFAIPFRAIGQQYTVIVAQDLAEQGDRLESAAYAVLLGIPLALVFAAGGGYLLARKSLAPVTTMSAKARQISAETLGDRIAVENDRDELGFLAVTLNDLLERLQRAFDSQRRFMADASHELRTPVAIIQGEADVVLSRSDRSSADYRESIEIMRNAARKLTRIVQDLFLLARTDAGSYPMSRSRFYLDEVLTDCARAMRSVAAAKKIEVTCDAPVDSVILADEELIHRMFLNLIENAVKFTDAGGRVRVLAERLPESYAIRVIDDGPGIFAGEQPRVFERFYRSDRLRRRAGGAGLGLPIAQWIAEAHEGRIVIEKSDASGTTFLVTLPIVILGSEDGEGPASSSRTGVAGVQ